MGIGDAYLGLVDLLSHYGKQLLGFTRISADSVEQCTEPDSIVQCLFGFVAETTLQSIKRNTDDTIANWYYTVNRLPPPCFVPDANPDLLALKNLHQEQPLRLGSLTATQAPPEARTAHQIVTGHSRHDAGGPFRTGAEPDARNEERVRGTERNFQST
jgi:hypothetical protein